MSKISVTTIAGLTSGGDANKVKIESGDDLVVNTDTLFADASADKVGINTTAMDASLEVNSASSKINTLTVKTAAGSGGVAGIGFMAGQTTAGREKAAIFFKETNGGAHYTGDIVFAVASSSGSAAQVAASDEVCRITPTGLAIGGTGAANTLDDYEEGTFTPVVSGSSSAGTGTFSTQSGVYTKVGNRVFGSCFITHSNTHNGSGAYQVSLPFVSTAHGGGAIVSYKYGWLNNGPDFADVATGQAQMYVRYDGNTAVVDLPFGNTQNTAQMRLVFSFETAS